MASNRHRSNDALSEPVRQQFGIYSKIGSQFRGSELNPTLTQGCQVTKEQPELRSWI